MWEYFTAIANREISWIKTYAKKEDDADQALAHLHIKLLEDFKLILPFITPQKEEGVAPVLWHGDLHAGNLFVDQDDPSKITSIIDWQGISLVPFFQQARFASIFDCEWNYIWGVAKPPLLRLTLKL